MISPGRTLVLIDRATHVLLIILFLFWNLERAVLYHIVSYQLTSLCLILYNVVLIVDLLLIGCLIAFNVLQVFTID